jgi:DNA-binding MarR family transcriptional regulator
MRRTRANQAFTELILEVFRLNGRLLSAGDALTRPVGQTSARWQILGALDNGPRTVADIGRRMGLTRQSVQRTADLLASDGLLSYVDNPAHQRAKLAKLTPRGEMTLDVITSRQVQWGNRVAGRLAEPDLQHAIRTLQQVRESLEQPAVSSEPTAGRPRLRGKSPRTTREEKRGRAS